MCCPEETHFYRWAEPFDTPGYSGIYKANATLLKHRELDGIAEAEFQERYGAARSRQQLQDAYMSLYARKCGKPQARWFDKTPQNIYGLPLLMAQVPGAKFVHIHRNPLNVVTSMYLGRMVNVPSIVGGANYWLEAMQIIDVCKPLLNDRLFEVAYESLTEQPAAELRRLLGWLGEDGIERIDISNIRGEQNLYREKLSPAQIGQVVDICGHFMQRYGYSMATDACAVAGA
jgi:hypothetical protein